MAKFRKKATVIEAVQFFYGGERVPGVFYPSADGKMAFVVTIHRQRAYLQDGDWVITEPDGEHHYPCKPDIFAERYEPVEESTMTLSEIVQQLRSCQYECEAGSLDNNVAFIALVEMANESLSHTTAAPDPNLVAC